MSTTIKCTSTKQQYCRLSLLQGVFLPAIVCLFYSWTFLPFFCDDAFISLRYVQNFIEGSGLIWSQGQAVEGYSNLAWILLVAIPGYFGADLVTATRVISTLLMLSVLPINYCYWRDFLTTHNTRYFLLAQYAFAFSATTGVWMVGGLEQPLLAAMMASSLLLLCHALNKNNHFFLLGASFCLGIMCLTRPDIPLLCFAVAIGVFFSRGFNVTSFYRCCLLAIFPVLMVLTQLIFRLYYYGEWLPNTAHIKANPSTNSFLVGGLYVVTGLLFMLPISFYVVKAIKIALKSDHRDLAAIAISAIGFTLCYLFIIGGDIFPAYRHFTIVVVIFIFILPALSLASADFHQSFNTAKITLLMLIYIILQWFNPATAFSRGDKWVLEGKPIAAMFKAGWQQKKPLIAVDAAGSLPFYTHYPAIDMLGLNDYHIARQTPFKNSGYIGHQFGDSEYVFARQPDLINFCQPQGQLHPCWPGGQALYKMLSFQQDYTPVAFRYQQNKTAIQWIRNESPIIGIDKSSSVWVIPAYLLKGEEITETYLNRMNHFVVDLQTKKYLRLNTGYLIDEVNIIPENNNITIHIHKLDNGYHLIFEGSVNSPPVESIQIKILD